MYTYIGLFCEAQFIGREGGREGGKPFQEEEEGP